MTLSVRQLNFNGRCNIGNHEKFFSSLNQDLQDNRETRFPENVDIFKGITRLK